MSVLYTHSAAPHHLIGAIRTHRIAALATVPRVLELLEEELLLHSAHHSASLLRRELGVRFFLIMVGGATLPRARELFWRHSLCLIVQGYGSTETTAFATLNFPLRGAIGSIGRPMHDDSLHLAEDGEILVRGPHVAAQYIGGDVWPDFTQNGYLRTGDLGRRDAKDRIYFVGRKHDRIVTAEGYNIQAEMVEAVLDGCHGVRGSVVISRESRGLEDLHAVLLLESATNAATVIQEANTRLLPHERIGSCSVWPEDDFPRGTLGKIRRDAVTLRLAQMGRPPSQSEETSASIETCLADKDRMRRIRKIAGYLTSTGVSPNQADLQTWARDWGLDSLEMVQLWSVLDSQKVKPARPEIGNSNLPNGSKSETTAHAPLAPGWQWLPGMKWVRALIRALIIDPGMPLLARVRVFGTENLRNVRSPFVVALHPDDREHAFDYLMVYRALPRSLSRKLFLVLGGGSPGLFDAYLNPSPLDHWAYRQFAKFLFYIGLPVLFPYSLFPHKTLAGTARGLNRTFAWMDRGYNPLMPWADGTALIAAQTNAATIPVRLDGNEGLNARRGWIRPTVSVTFGAPVEPRVGTPPHLVCRLVFRKLQEMQTTGSPRSD